MNLNRTEEKMNKKNNLDEMQEQKLLYVESRGCWFCFWGLLVLMFAQLVIFGIKDAWRYIAGEWLLFMCLAVYIVFECMKNGIWDRKLKPNSRTNLIISAVDAAVFGTLMAVIKMREFPDNIIGSVLTGVILGVGVFIVCLVLLEISKVIYQKRVDKLENEPEDDDEPEDARE